MRRTSLTVLAILSCGVFAVLLADDKADHALMRKEHVKVHQEHDVLLKQLAKWRIEHRKALAALRVIEASILDHEASLEQLAEHAREHEDHIHHHEEEFAEHEKDGDAKDHAKLADMHKKLIDEHEKMSKLASEFHDDHDAMMSSLTKLRESLGKHK